MGSFDDFVEAVAKDVTELAKNTFSGYAKEAVVDAKSFLKKSKSDIEKWAKQLAAGEISKEDFEWLLKGMRDLAAMERLKQKGLAEVEIDKFRNSLLDLVVKNVIVVL